MKLEEIPGNEWMKDWGWEWKAPDYVEGSHPMDTGEVTWHHVWEKPLPQKVKGEE